MCQILVDLINSGILFDLNNSMGDKIYKRLKDPDMKNLIVQVFGILTISLLIVNCKSDVTVPGNSITYNNTVYGLNSGFLENYGNIHGSGINIDLTLISSGLTPVITNGVVDSIIGTGNGINVELFSSTSTALDLGDYTYDANKTGAAGTFDFANVILNFNTDTEQGINLDINGGKVTVLSNGSEYELTFSLSSADGKSVTGYYKGSLTFYNRSVSMKSGKIKKAWKW